MLKKINNYLKQLMEWSGKETIDAQNKVISDYADVIKKQEKELKRQKDALDTSIDFIKTQQKQLSKYKQTGKVFFAG